MFSHSDVCVHHKGATTHFSLYSPVINELNPEAKPGIKITAVGKPRHSWEWQEWWQDPGVCVGGGWGISQVPAAGSWVLWVEVHGTENSFLGRQMTAAGRCSSSCKVGIQRLQPMCCSFSDSASGPSASLKSAEIPNGTMGSHGQRDQLTGNVHSLWDQWRLIWWQELK